MKDAESRVLYIGKAKNIRDRVSSYFQPSADLMQSRGPKIVEMLAKVAEVTYLECDSDVDAILQEARLIKDIQPPYNTRQTDDKTFPYLEITLPDDFPRIRLTRKPLPGSRLFGPFTSGRDLRRVIQVLQRIFRFCTCKLDIRADDETRRFNRPCVLYDIGQCSGPCADRISKDDYRADIRRLIRFLESKRAVVLRELNQEMTQAAADLQYELAARLRDEIQALESLSDRGEVDEHIQPEVFQVDPHEGLTRLTELLDAPRPIRIIEGIDIAHIMGNEAVGSLVCFIDGRPFKKGYRRFRIREVKGIDDYAMIAEVVRRRFRRADPADELYPDVILIDGGLGQLHAALGAMEGFSFAMPLFVSLAKKEELLFTTAGSDPVRLARNDSTLRLLQYVRDEAHRFARHYFHILRNQRAFDTESS